MISSPGGIVPPSFRRAHRIRKKLLSFPCCPAQTGWTVGTQGYVCVLVGQKAADGARRVLANHLTGPGKLVETQFHGVKPQTTVGVLSVSFFAPAIVVEEINNFSLGIRTITQSATSGLPESQTLGTSDPLEKNRFRAGFPHTI